jgi:hypothetical protein
MKRKGLPQCDFELPPLKRGDKVVCICKEWDNFTYGKTYTVITDVLGSIIQLKNNDGELQLPSLYHPKGYYFVTPEIFREIKLNEIFN